MAYIIYSFLLSNSKFVAGLDTRRLPKQDVELFMRQTISELGNPLRLSSRSVRLLQVTMSDLFNPSLV